MNRAQVRKMKGATWRVIRKLEAMHEHFQVVTVRYDTLEDDVCVRMTFWDLRGYKRLQAGLRWQFQEMPKSHLRGILFQHVNLLWDYPEEIECDDTPTGVDDERLRAWSEKCADMRNQLEVLLEEVRGFLAEVMRQKRRLAGKKGR